MRLLKLHQIDLGDVSPGDVLVVGDDGTLGVAPAPERTREQLVASGITPPTPLTTSDESDYLYGLEM